MVAPPPSRSGAGSRPLVVFDTEYTAWEGSMVRGWSEPWESREIVQIGAIKTTLPELDALGTFEVVVKPTRNPALSEYFIRLTGITQARVEAEGIDLPTALDRLYAFAGEAPLLCWGRDDEPIREHLGYLNEDLRRVPAVTDVRTFFERAGVSTRGVRSGQIGGVMGSTRPIRAHDAVEDCWSILEGLRRLPASVF